MKAPKNKTIDLSVEEGAEYLARCIRVEAPAALNEVLDRTILGDCLAVLPLLPVGFADLLPTVQDENDRQQLISEIQNNNQKLLRIIDGLVSMSKIEAGAKSLLMAHVDLNQMLQKMVDSIQISMLLFHVASSVLYG